MSDEVSTTISQPTEKNYSASLKQYFDKLITQKFGDLVPPDAIVTPFGIKTLDTILGGGIASSLFTAFSSAPETGKSTLAFQFAASFIRNHNKSVVLYIDTEGASSVNNSSDFLFQTRISSFKIPEDRITYIASPLNLAGVFELITTTIAAKKEVQKRTNDNYQLLIILDSLASTPSSKDALVIDPNEVIGFKARELTHYISRIKADLIMNQITMIVIDQVRANMKINSRFVTPDDKGVGEFSTNFKAATNVNSFQHAVRQWVYMSKGSNLTLNDGFGVDGFVLNVVLEKNKLAPSKIVIPLVFDKKFGAIPQLSEYLFIAEHTKFEKKTYKEAGLKKIYPVLVEASGHSKIINIIDFDTGEIIEKSEKFNERTLLKNYYTNSKFKDVFDKAVDMSIQERIVKPFFNRSSLTDNSDVDVDS